ncbi:MAG: hypothetical protein ACOYNP_03730 [Gemmataceae bacterium]|jgi:phage FluMu protein Com
MPVRFRCGHCRQLMAISTRKIGSLVPCPTCQTMIEVPKTDMATSPVQGGLNRDKQVKQQGQPLLEEDFDRVIAEPDIPDPHSGTPPPRTAGPGQVLPVWSMKAFIASIALSGLLGLLVGILVGILLGRSGATGSGGMP